MEEFSLNGFEAIIFVGGSFALIMILASLFQIYVERKEDEEAKANAEQNS